MLRRSDIWFLIWVKTIWLADSVIVGKTLGSDALAAVGSTSIIIYFVFCFINGFTGGFGICLGQAFGAKDESGMRKSIAVSIILCIFFTVILTLICGLFSHSFITLMRIPDDISKDAYSYMFVVLIGTGATVFYNMISNILRALGDYTFPVFVSFIKSVYGSEKFEILHLHRADFKNLKKAMIRHLKTGFPMGFQMSVMCIGIIVLRHPIVRLFLTKPSHTIYHYSDMYLTVVAL